MVKLKVACRAGTPRRTWAVSRWTGQEAPTGTVTRSALRQRGAPCLRAVGGSGCRACVWVISDSRFRSSRESGESGHSRSLSDMGLLHIARGWLRVWLPVAAVASGPSGSAREHGSSRPQPLRLRLPGHWQSQVVDPEAPISVLRGGWELSWIRDIRVYCGLGSGRRH